MTKMNFVAAMALILTFKAQAETKVRVGVDGKVTGTAGVALKQSEIKAQQDAQRAQYQPGYSNPGGDPELNGATPGCTGGDPESGGTCTGSSSSSSSNNAAQQGVPQPKARGKAGVQAEARVYVAVGTENVEGKFGVKGQAAAQAQSMPGAEDSRGKSHASGAIKGFAAVETQDSKFHAELAGGKEFNSGDLKDATVFDAVVGGCTGNMRKNHSTSVQMCFDANGQLRLQDGLSILAISPEITARIATEGGTAFKIGPKYQWSDVVSSGPRSEGKGEHFFGLVASVETDFFPSGVRSQKKRGQQQQQQQQQGQQDQQQQQQGQSNDQ